MAMVNAVTRKLIEEVLVRTLTGKERDLERVLALARTIEGPMMKAFLRGFTKESYKRNGFAQLFLRLGREANPLCKRKIVRNLGVIWAIDGARKRAALEQRGSHAPSHIVISPSMRCNLKCRGCYSGMYSKEGELSEAEIDRILGEAEEIGSSLVVVSGGEPYLMKDVWLRLWEKHPRMYFLTYTNGTLLDEDTVQALARLGNVSPAISIEGFREETDRRRGAGVFDAVLGSMQRLKAARLPFGVSVTYTRENAEVVSSEEFVRFCVEQGALYGWYFMFVPVGKDPVLELVPTPEQRLEVGKRVSELRQKVPIFLADFWNDGPSVGGCLAGGRLYLHIVNSGRVECCVFAHFGVDNIREKSLLEAANSPFFRDIRSRHPYNENGNLKRPCMIVDNPLVLRELVDKHMVPQGHAHEDIIHDPTVVAWIDRYSERFKELTDPLWEEEISDPEGRWYWNGPDFRRLFKNADRSDAPRPPRTQAAAAGAENEPAEARTAR